MRLIHMTCGSQPDISRCVDDFGVELAHNFAASHDNGFDGAFQVSIHYLDGFSDPDFFEHVWGRA